MLFEIDSSNAEECIGQPVFASTETSYVWLYVYVGFVVLHNLIQIAGFVEQRRILGNIDEMKRQYSGFDQKLQDLYPWQKVEESARYNKDLFTFLTYRHVFYHIPFDAGFVLLGGPVYFWNYYMGKLLKWGTCQNGSGALGTEILCALLVMITYRLIQIGTQTPWFFYQMYGIEKAHGLAMPTVLGVLIMQIFKVLEFTLLVLPVSFLMIALMSWTGDYLVLAVAGGTAIVKLAISWFYPKLIAPLLSSSEKLPAWADPIREQITEQANNAGIDPEEIYLSRKPFYDFHSAASCFMGRITLDLNIFWNHGEHPAEILAILSHECGHYSQSHLVKQSLVDTVYMIIFATLLWCCTNEPSLLLSFGFTQESYTVSFLLFVLIYSVSLDVPLRCGINWVTRHFELQADKFAVFQGYGKPLRDSLIRSHSISLDTLFYGQIDHILCSTHPTIHERLTRVEEEIEKISSEQRDSNARMVEKLNAAQIELPKEDQKEAIMQDYEDSPPQGSQVDPVLSLNDSKSQTEPLLGQ